MKTVEAIMREDGVIELLEPLKFSGKRRVLITILADEEQEVNLRPAGLAKGLFEIPANFDDPLPNDILDDFSS